MLMKWEDLEVGDEIKFRDETIKYLEEENERDGYFNFYKGKTLKIWKIEVRKYYDEITIYYHRGIDIYKHFTINFEGRRRSDNFGPIFEIVKLKDD